MATQQLIQQEVLDEIAERANDQIDLVLSELGMDVDSVRGFNDEVRCSCPVHKGDNPTSFCYNSKYKRWRCYTHNCHEGKDRIFGLAQLLLAEQYTREVPFQEAVDWLAKLLNVKVNLDSEDHDPQQEQLYKLIKQAKLKKNIKQKIQPSVKQSIDYPFPLSKIEGKIEPSWYFLEQGFTPEILRKYNVGYSDNPRKPMYLRSYAPVLDEKGQNVIGVTGRIKYEKCEFCPYFHEQGKGCPKDNPNIRGYSKWSHHGFNTGSVMYNSWFADKYIQESGIAIVTEGPKDVWWLEQFDVHNSICVFGLNILDYHLNKLIKMGCTKIVVALDNDERGIEAMEKINQSLAMYFKMINIHGFLRSGEDIADVPADRMNQVVVPFLKSLKR